MFKKIKEKLRLKKRKKLLNSLCVYDETSVIDSQAQIFNNLGDREAIQIAGNTVVSGCLMTFGHGGFIKIGEYCYVGDGAKVWSAKSITIGNRVLISHNVNIFDNRTHPIDPYARHIQFKACVTTGFPKEIAGLDERPIVIKDDVWIGAMSIISRGVTIGEGAIVAAGSVVTKDVDPFTIVGGNPAKFIKIIDVNKSQDQLE